MTGETNQHPMAWRYCGNQLKRWRELAGVSRESLASEAGYGYDAIKAMERGVRRPQLSVLRVADELCGARGLLIAAVDYLKPEKFPTYSYDFMQAENDAIAHSSFENEFIPGLLQTEETARALLSSHCPPLDDETIVERVAARLDRQMLLARQTRAFSFVIAETALRNSMVDRPAHLKQLRHLLKTGEQRNVTIQVMPTDCGYHPGRLRARRESTC